MKKLLMTTLFLCLSVLWLSADPIDFSTAGITMDVPAGWNYEISEASDQILITSPDNLLVMVFIPLPVEGLDADSDTDEIIELAMETAVATVLQGSPDAQFDDPEEYDFNGIPAVIMDGSGSMEEVPVEISLIMLVGDVPVMGIAYLLPGSDIYDDDLDDFVKSIGPM